MLNERYDKMVKLVDELDKLAKAEYDDIKASGGSPRLWMPMDYASARCDDIRVWLDVYADACSDEEHGTSGEPEKFRQNKEG